MFWKRILAALVCAAITRRSDNPIGLLSSLAAQTKEGAKNNRGKNAR
jgi:hypothetical protein